jgi:hypothetical protein
MSQRQVPGGRRGRGRRGLRLGAALIVAASTVGGTLLAAAPAHALSQSIIHPEWVDGCPGCPGPIFLVDRELDQRTVSAVTTAVANGLSGLIAANHAQDPAAGKRLHAAAIASFTRATQLTGYAGFSGVADWDGDLCPPWPWPWPRPHWADVEKELGAGLTLIGQAAVTKDVDRAAELRAAGISDLETGTVGLETFQGCTAAG